MHILPYTLKSLDYLEHQKYHKCYVVERVQQIQVFFLKLSGIFFLFPNQVKIHGCGTHSYGEDYTVFIIFFLLRDQFYLALA